MSRRPPSIELHVEELVLEGFAPADRHAVADAFERELTRLLGAHGLASSQLAGGATAQVDAGSVRVAPRGGAQAAGAQIARAVYGGLRR